MGAWSYGIFDDDTAYDFVDEIKTDPIAFFKSSFEYAIQVDFLGFDESHAVTVSAAYIDQLLNGTTYRTDGDYDEYGVNNFRATHKNLNVDDLRILAIKALEKVVSKDSDLYNVWLPHEELHLKWKQTLLDLIERLR